MAKLQLRPTEKNILGCLNLNGDASFAEISRQTGAPVHSVQYLVRKLQDVGAIRWTPIIDIHTLGLSYYGLFFSTANTGSTEDLLAALKKHPRVAYLSEFAGGFRYGIALMEASASAAVKTFNEIALKSKAIITKKCAATRTALWELPRGYLNGYSYHEPRRLSAPSVERVDLRPEELVILQHLATTEFRSYRETARKLGISHTTADSRLRALRSKKVLLDPLFAVTGATLGKSQYKLLVYANGLHPGLGAALLKLLKRYPGAHHFVECFGEWDFEINLDVDGPEEAMQTIDDLMSRSRGNLGDIILLNTVKLHFRRSCPGDLLRASA